MKTETWEYQSGSELITVTDTVSLSRNSYKNPFLSTIESIDSIDSIIKFNNWENQFDSALSENNYQLTKSEEEYFQEYDYAAFRGNLTGESLQQNLNFVYLKGVGVISYYVYGYGHVKLISKQSGSKIVTIERSFYPKLFESDILFPVNVPDSIVVHDFNVD